MSRQKAATRAPRKLRRCLRKESRSSRLKEINNVASFADFTGIETIGMACETRDRSPIIPRSEAQRKYIEAIKWQKLILANGVKPGCGKIFISSAMAADALINKESIKLL